jgi:hypothetical protein
LPSGDDADPEAGWVIKMNGESEDGLDTMHVGGEFHLMSAQSLQGRGRYLHSNAEEGEGLSWGEKNDEFNWTIECENEDEGLTPGSVVHLKSKFSGGVYWHSNGEDGASWGERDAALAWVLEFPPGLYSGQFVHLEGVASSQFWRGNCEGEEEVGVCWDESKGESAAWLIEADSSETVIVDKGAIVHLKSMRKVKAGGKSSVIACMIPESPILKLKHSFHFHFHK